MPSLNTSISDLRARLNDLGPKLAHIKLAKPGAINLPKLGAISLPALGSRSRSRGPSLVTGLDIEPGQVIAAEVHLNGGVSVVRAGGTPLSPDVVRDGEVADVEALTEALRTVFAEHKLSRQVRVGVANQRIMVRTIELPPIADPKELEAAVRFKAQDEIPMPPDSVVLDFHSLGVVETMSGPRQRVLLVAARRDMVERLLAALEGAGLRPEGIDLAGFALIRALHRRGSDPDTTVLYLHVSGLTNLVVARGVSCVFTRVLGTGLEAIAQSVAERCSVPIDEARALVFRVGLAGGQQAPAMPPIASLTPHAESVTGLARDAHADPPASSEDAEPAHSLSDVPGPDSGDAEALAMDPADPGVERVELPSHVGPDPAASTSAHAPAAADSSPVGDELQAGGGPATGSSRADLEREATVRAAVSDGVRLIIAEVRNSLDYHLAQLGGGNGGGSVQQVILSGPATGVPGLVDALSTELKLPVSVGEVQVEGTQALQGVPASRLAIAAGLAVYEVSP